MNEDVETPDEQRPIENEVAILNELAEELNREADDVLEYQSL